MVAIIMMEMMITMMIMVMMVLVAKEAQPLSKEKRTDCFDVLLPMAMCITFIHFQTTSSNHNVKLH